MPQNRLYSGLGHRKISVPDICRIRNAPLCSIQSLICPALYVM